MEQRLGSICSLTGAARSPADTFKSKTFQAVLWEITPFIFFLQVTAKWKSLSLPKLQAPSSPLKTQTFFFSGCNFLLQCSAKGFGAQGKGLPIQLPTTHARRCSFGRNTWSRHPPVPFPLCSLDAPAENSSCSGASMQPYAVANKHLLKLVSSCGSHVSD